MFFITNKTVTALWLNFLIYMLAFIPPWSKFSFLNVSRLKNWLVSRLCCDHIPDAGVLENKKIMASTEFPNNFALSPNLSAKSLRIKIYPKRSTPTKSNHLHLCNFIKPP